MLAENLFEKIGYTDQEICEYKKYKSLINDDFEALAQETVTKDISISDSCEKARRMVPQICGYAADLMLFLSALDIYYKNTVKKTYQMICFITV